jgi:hypothetical protein
MMATPGEMPITVPVADTLANGAPPDHEPPETVGTIVAELPTQIVSGPVSTAGTGRGLTVTITETDEVPQTLVTE